MKISLVLPIILIVAAAFAADSALPQPSISALIDQLGAADFPTREFASETILKRGPAVLPELQERAASQKDPEVAARLQQAIYQIEENAIVNPCVISVDIKDATAAEAFAEIKRQLVKSGYFDDDSIAGLKLTPAAIEKGKKVTLSMKEKPMLEVMEQFAKQAGLGVASQYGNITFDAATPAPWTYFQPPIAAVVAARISRGTRTVEGPIGPGLVEGKELQVTLWHATPEAHVGDSFNVISAIDEQGHRIGFRNSGGGSGHTATFFTLAAHNTDAEKLASLKARISFWMVIKEASVKLPEDGSWKAMGEGFRARLAKNAIEEDKDGTKFHYRFEVEAPVMEKDKFEQVVSTWDSLQDFIQWTDAKGKQTGFGGSGTLPIDRENRILAHDFIAPIKPQDAARHLSLTIRMPIRIKLITQDVELKDIPFPPAIVRN